MTDCVYRWEPDYVGGNASDRVCDWEAESFVSKTDGSEPQAYWIAKAHKDGILPVTTEGNR